MNFRFLNALAWGNSVALAWMWGLGLFFSIQMAFMFGLQGLLLFAIPNALGLMLFGVLTHIVAHRHDGGRESLARFFEKFSRPFRLIFYIYQILALSLTVFALTKYLFGSLDLVTGGLFPFYLVMAALLVLAAGCLSGEEFGIQKIKYGHAMGSGLLALCIGVVLFHVIPDWPENGLPWGEPSPGLWTGPTLAAYAVPLIVGLLVGPWLDLQHWQRAIQIHREGASIRLGYFFGGIIFLALLLFHGCFALWVLSRGGIADYGSIGLDKFQYAHQLIVEYINRIDAETRGLLPAAYFSFLTICVLTTIDSGYIALKWFLGNAVARSKSIIVGMLPKRLLDSPIPTFVLVAFIALVALALRLELEFFMIFFASFFVGYAGLAIARCFVPNSQQPLPQIRMFSVAAISVVLFAFGYITTGTGLMLLASLLPLAYVAWLVFNTDLLRVVHERADEVIEIAAKIPAIQAITGKPAIPASSGAVTAPADGHALAGHFEGKWFVYSFIATYQDTNSVGNVYFGMYPMFVGKTRELFFNHAMPDFDLKDTSFYILTRSIEHKFVREAREFDTITVKIRVADFNRKFCTLEHQIFGSEGELLGKGKQSLLFVSSKDYSLLDIPPEVYTAFSKYL